MLTLHIIGSAAYAHSELPPGVGDPLTDYTPKLLQQRDLAAKLTKKGVITGRSWIDLFEGITGGVEVTKPGVKDLEQLEDNGDISSPVFDLSASMASVYDSTFNTRKALRVALSSFPGPAPKSIIVIGYGSIGQACAAELIDLFPGVEINVAEADPPLALKASQDGLRVGSFSTP